MPNFFYRYTTAKIHQSFQKNQIVILVGARQTGKTMLIKNYFNNFLKKNIKALYFNFEKSADLEIFQNINHFTNYLSQNNLSIKNKLFIAIDEFQYLKNATKFLKLLYDEYPNIQILATGSSAIEIRKHLKESLAGRKKIYHLYPLSFEEYLLSVKQANLWNKLKYNNALPYQIKKLNHKLLSDYLLWGGYPRLADKYKLLNNEEKKEELYDIYDSYLQKDIKELIGGENILAFNNLVKLLAGQIGNLLNINELSNTIGLNRYEIEKYLSILEHTFIIKKIPPYFTNKRKEISKMPKIYFSDLGLVNMIIANFGKIELRSNLGAILENYTLNQIHHFMSIADSMYFWRNLEGAEIDFIWKRDDMLIPIEAKWKNFSEPKIPVNLLNFSKKHKNIKQAWIVNQNFYAEKKTKNINFIFMPASLLLKKLHS